MMKPLLMACIVACGAVSCGEGPGAPPPPKTDKAGPAPIEIGAATTGKNTCVGCNLKTDNDSCPKCGATLRAKASAPAPNSHASANIGKTSVGAMWVCPKKGCTFSSARSEKCLGHKDVDLVEQLYRCSGCGTAEPVPGKCSGCKGDLAPTVKR